MKYKRLLYFIGLILIIIGHISFIGGFLISSRLIEFNHELPLGHTEGIVVSNDSRIYLGMHFYDKIQCYDANGNFLKNWKVDNSGGAFKIDIHEDTIIVATARGDYLIKYDLNGNKLSQETINRIYTKYDDINQFTYKSNESIYKINNRFFSSISKERKGEIETIISTPILLTLFAWPLPAFLLGIIGAMILLIINNNKMISKINRYKQKVSKRFFKSKLTKVNQF